MSDNVHMDRSFALHDRAIVTIGKTRLTYIYIYLGGRVSDHHDAEHAATSLDTFRNSGFHHLHHQQCPQILGPCQISSLGCIESESSEI